MQSNISGSSRNTANAAIDYAQRGWLVFSVHSIQDGSCTCGKSDCHSPGKHPRTANGLKNATTDANIIVEWWREWPDANVGVVTGAESGIVVIDIDTRHDGDKSLDALEAEHGTLPATVTACTAGGGFHFVFKHPGDTIRNRSNVRPGIDVRGDGGYIVAPPSNHASGDVYRWDEARAPDETELAEILDWLLDLITSEPDHRAERNGATPSSPVLLLQRAQQYASSADAAGEGSRNDAAYRLGGHIGAFTDVAGSRLTEGEVFDVLRSWNQRNSPPLDEAELRQCVSSSLTNGTPRPPKVVSSGGGLSRLIIGNRDAPQLNADLSRIEKFTFADLAAGYPTLKPKVVDGLFRAGETVNLISVSKIGKSWLAYLLALCIIMGRLWLDKFQTSRGRVLLIDNELHRETLAHRIPKVAEQLGLFSDDYNTQLDVWPLRGDLRNLYQLGADFNDIEHGEYKAIIIDAKYRALPAGTSENDNADEAALYNVLDQYAERQRHDRVNKCL